MRYFSAFGTVGIALAALICSIIPSYATGGSEKFQSGFEEGGICFYEETNYKGRKFCAKPGEKISQLKTPWDKNFASLRMEGKVLVYVCNKSHFGGSCRFFNKTLPSFGSGWNNRISSVQIGFKSGKKGKRRKSAPPKNTPKPASVKNETPKQVKKPKVAEKPVRLAPPPKPEEIKTKEPEEEKVASRHIEISKPAKKAEKQHKKEPVSEESDEEPIKRTPLPQRKERDDRKPDDKETEIVDLDGKKEDEEGEEENENREEACFFEYANFKGRSFCVSTNKTFELLEGRWNDNISSFSIVGDIKVRLCDKPDLLGECETYTKGKKFVSWFWNDRFSSLKVKFKNIKVDWTKRKKRRFPVFRWGTRNGEGANQGGEACFYEGPLYDGKEFCLKDGKSMTELAEGWNNNISSIYLTGNARVRICKENGFKGYCRTYYTSRETLGEDWDNQTSSIKVQKTQSR